MKRKVLAAILAGAMACGLVACGGGAEKTKSEAPTAEGKSEAVSQTTDKDGLDVGLVTIAYTDEFCTLLAKQIQEKGAEIGYNVTLVDGECDAQTQIDQINTFITKGVDAIILQAADCAGIVPGVKAANDAGVPVICTEVVPTGGDFTYCGPVSYDAGYMQGKKLAEMYPDGCNVLYLQGTSGMTHALQRREGFEAAVAEIGNNINILDAQDGDFVKDEGMRITEAWIQKYTDNSSDTGVSFQAIVSGNDQMILGAMEALKTAGIADGAITLMGIDGTAPCVKAVADGKMTCTVFQNSLLVADSNIACLKDIAAGKELEPEYTIDWELVDESNYADYQ